MKNYFQKILSLFARHNYSEQTNQMFYRWLVNGKHPIKYTIKKWLYLLSW